MIWQKKTRKILFERHGRLPSFLDTCLPPCRNLIDSFIDTAAGNNLASITHPPNQTPKGIAPERWLVIELPSPPW